VPCYHPPQLLSSHTPSLQELTPSSSTTYFATLPKRPGQLVVARSPLHKYGLESPAAYTHHPGVRVLQPCSGTKCTCLGASSRAAAKRSSTTTGSSVTFYRIIFGRVTLSTSSETCGGWTCKHTPGSRCTITLQACNVHPFQL
jgi:hypothetical protein